MPLPELTATLNAISELDTVIRGQATTVKAAFDHDVNIIKDYINGELIPSADVAFETKENITSGRKLSADGNFTGTWNGHEMVETDPGIQIVVNEHTSQLADIVYEVNTNKLDKSNLDTATAGQVYTKNIDGTAEFKNPLGGGTAESISYDNSTSGLPSINVQAAVDALKNDLDALNQSNNAPSVINYYNNGDECISLTGGWITGYTSGSGTQTKNTNNLYAQTTSVGAFRTYVTTNKVDMTLITKLFIEVNLPICADFDFQISNVSDGVTSTSSRIQLKSTNTMKTIYVMDVSSLTGAYYISFCSRDTTTAYVYQVWGETSSSSGITSSKWVGRTWCVQGDSISEVNGTSTYRYHDIIKSKLGMTVYNYGLSGSGYAVGTTEAIAVRVSSMADGDLITVFAGTNDWGRTGITIPPLGTFGDTTTASFYGALDNVINQLIAKYPTKTIALITPSPRENDNVANGNGNYLSQYVEAIIKVGNKYSVPVLDLYSNSNIYPRNVTSKATFMPDGLHPNNAGHSRIADKILAFLNTL